MSLTTRLTAIERAKRSEARLIKRHILELATSYNLPLGEMEAEYKRIQQITEAGERLFPNDVDRQISYAAEQFGIDETELRSEVEELTQNGLSIPAKRGR